MTADADADADAAGDLDSLRCSSPVGFSDLIDGVFDAMGQWEVWYGDGFTLALRPGSQPKRAEV